MKDPKSIPTKSKYGLWVENQKGMKWLKRNTLFTIAGIISLIIIYIYLLILTLGWNEQGNLGTGRYNFFGYAIFFLTIFIIIGLARLWLYLYFRRRATPVRIKTDSGGITWQGLKKEKFIPWTKVGKDVPIEYRLKELEEDIVRDVIKHGKTTIRTWRLGWFFLDEEIISEIKNSYEHYVLSKTKNEIISNKQY